MEAKISSRDEAMVNLTSLFSDVVRLEIELWDLVDRRLRSDHDLPLSWFEPMQVIDDVPQCRIADIAEALSITVGGTSKLVGRIERAGWCSRAPNPDDTRSSVLTLTRAGRSILSAAQHSFEEELEILLGAALSSAKLASFAVIVRDLRQHVADQQRRGQ